MKRLSHQIHLTIVAALLLFAVLVAVAFVALPDGAEGVPADGLALVAAHLLPPRDRPGPELTAALDRWARELRLDLSVYDEEGRPLASSGRPIVLLSPRRPRQQMIHGRVVLVTLRLPDGRWLAARAPRPLRRGPATLVGVLLLMAAAIAIAAWPVVRKLTGRLERLRGRVEDLGEGHLGARAAIEGKDEVAALARSFNRAAERIENLVESQRRMLAFASHELRSPLARLRLSVEMMAAEPAMKARAGKDLGELAGLIDELLEASRLQARRVATDQEVDLLALVAEEAARTGAEVGGQPAVVIGDARLLRRLVRNLLENARRYGGTAPAEASVSAAPGRGALLTVADRGPGIPPSERDRIFEPYYRPQGTAETGEGYGLGLALVRQIAEAHGGHVRCLARDGGGTVFEVALNGAAGSA
jgi:signal transduction histidine kinase